MPGLTILSDAELFTHLFGVLLLNPKEKGRILTIPGTSDNFI